MRLNRTPSLTRLETNDVALPQDFAKSYLVWPSVLTITFIPPFYVSVAPHLFVSISLSVESRPFLHLRHIRESESSILY